MCRKKEIGYDTEPVMLMREDTNSREYICQNCKLRRSCDYKYTPVNKFKSKKRTPHKEAAYYERDGEEHCPVAQYCVEIIQCGDAKWVADGIGKDYGEWQPLYKRKSFTVDMEPDDGYRNWQPSKPVFIQAPTGRGKNHFIENVLLEYIWKLNQAGVNNKKILILSNRIAVREQQKNRLENKKFVTVLSYQSFMSQIDELRKAQQDEDSKYSHVIFDEAHFFVSDSMFNPHTDEILSSIVETFQNAVRIYMTATPHECLRYIAKKEGIPKRFKSNPEEKHFKNLIRHRRGYSEKMYYYNFNRDYSYLDIKYFSKHNDLKDIIAESVANGEKWVLFIDNKKQCEEFKNALIAVDERGEPLYGLYEEDILVISSEVKQYENSRDKKEKEIYNQYQDMVDNEKFKQKILISTSVIDNGVNLKDTAIKHVAVSDLNKDKVMQQVGRVRVDREKGEKITLYMKKFDVKYMKKRIDDLEKRINAYHSWELAYNNPDDFSPENNPVFTKKFTYMLLEGQSEFKDYMRNDSEYAEENKNYNKNYYSGNFYRMNAAVAPNPINERKTERREFLNKYYRGEAEDMERATHLFFTYNGVPELVYPNAIAYSLVYNTLWERYKSILNIMQETGDGQRYLAFQLSWFGKSYNPENEIGFDKKINVEKYLESKADVKMFENEKAEFRQRFTALSIAAFGKRKNDSAERIENSYGAKKIKDVLAEENLNFILDTDGLEDNIDENGNKQGTKSYWVIRKKSDNPPPK